MKKKFFLILSVFFAQLLFAQNVDLSDSFKQILVNTFCVDVDGDGIRDGDADTNDDGEIQVSEAEAVTRLYLNANAYTLSSLVGIENFINIEFLDCSNEQLTQLDLSQNLALVELDCSNNQITNLFLGENSNLQKLSCYSNEIDNLNLDANINIEEIRCWNNNLSVLDVSQMSSLIVLRCDNNNISSIDVSINMILEVLDLSNNQVDNLILGQKPELIDLICKYNLLTNIVVDDAPNLDRFDIQFNQLSNLIISNNTQLEYLNCSFNSLNTIDVSNNSLLQQLYVQNNFLSEIDISQNILLEDFSCGNNEISSLDISTNLSLIEMYCNHNLIEELNVSNNVQLNKLSCTNNQISSLDVSQNLFLSELLCDFNQLTEIDISNNSLLLYFHCSNNQITNLDFSNHPQMFQIYCGNNLLTSLDLSETTFFGLDISNSSNLEFLNIKNGANQQIFSFFFDLIDCVNLEVVCVDDIAYAQENFIKKEPLTTFNDDCTVTSVNYNTISGELVLDTNDDGCNIDDIRIPNTMIKCFDGENEYSTFTDDNGLYEIELLNTTYITSVIGLPEQFTSIPENPTTTFIEFGNDEIIDFCVVAAADTFDVDVHVFDMNNAVPGFVADYQIIYKNNGAFPVSGNVSFQFDNNKLDFLNASQTPDAQNSNLLTFNYSDLLPFEIRTINVSLNVFAPPIVFIGNILTFTVIGTPFTGDADVSNNSKTLQQTVVNSFDPNDKSVIQGSEIFIDDIGNDLDYIVRFQNTGTANATIVRITDVLDDKLNWDTFQPLSSSHYYNVRIFDGNFVEFIFENIDLPPEMDDEAGSQGFIAFKIKPIDNLLVGDIIEGQANIYFDFNIPIITNLVQTEIVVPLSDDDNTISSIKLYPNPFNQYLTIHSEKIIDFILIYDINGRLLKRIIPEQTNNMYILELDDLSKGLYFINIEIDNNIFSKKIIKN